MEYITTADRVVIKPEPKANMSSSGLYVAKSDSDTTEFGTVISVGPGRVSKKNVTIPVDVSPGDRIMFMSGTGASVRVNGESLLILKEDEIIGIVE